MESSPTWSTLFTAFFHISKQRKIIIRKMGRFYSDSDSSVCSYEETLESEIEETQSSISSEGNDAARNDGVSMMKEKKKSQVLLEGYVESIEGDDDSEDLKRAKSLTDEDLEELKGCLDLGFGGFSYEEIPELCNTLPALELCYSMSQKFMDNHENHRENSPERMPPTAESTAAPPIASWKISSPGDNPDDVKARLKYWAQAVACTVRLCS